MDFGYTVTVFELDLLFILMLWHIEDSVMLKLYVPMTDEIIYT